MSESGGAHRLLYADQVALERVTIGVFCEG